MKLKKAASVAALDKTSPDEGNGGPLLWLAPEDHPKVDHLITEDGKPVDNLYIAELYRLLTEPLKLSWTGTEEEHRFVAVTNVGLFFANRNPPLVPDFLLSLGVVLPQDLLMKEHCSYFVWEFGKPPDVLGEIVSDRRGGEDTFKLRECARLGIKYYRIYDPHNLLGGGVLRVYGLHPDGFRLIPDHRMEAVGLSLTLWTGTYSGVETMWLRWCDRHGQLIPTAAERLEQERQRLEEANQEIERLKTLLRQAGVAMPPEASTSPAKGRKRRKK